MSLKILYLMPFIPYPLNRGTNQRVFHLLKSLAEVHQVTTLALDPDNRISLEAYAALNRFCHEVRMYPMKLNPWRSLKERLFDPLPDTLAHWFQADLLEVFRAELQKENYDLIYCEDICMSHYFYHLNPDIPVISDRNRVDSSFQLERKQYLQSRKEKWLYHENLLKLKHFEKKLIRRFPHQVVCSQDDGQFVISELHAQHKDIAVIRNGIQAGYFKPQAMSWKTNAPTLCFTGAMDYAPNVDGMRWYFETIHGELKRRFPNLQLYIVGLNPVPEVSSYGELDGVHVTGRVEDIRPYYANCDVYICPIRIGGGTRLKIVEAMAMGKAVVSTSTGCQGLDLVSEEHLYMRDTPESFIAGVSELLKQKHKAEAMAERGRNFVLEHFSWQQLGQDLRSYIERVAQEQPRRAA